VRERRPHLILAAIILIVLAGVGALSRTKHVTKGIDLAGGIEVVLKAVPTAGHKITPADLSRSKAIMEQRINSIGAKEPDVRTQGSDEIVIELPGVKNPAEALAIIGKTAQLEIYDMEPALFGPSKGSNNAPATFTDVYKLLTTAGQKPIESTAGIPSDTANASSQWIVVTAKKHKLLSIKANAELAKRALAKGHRSILVPPRGSKLIICNPKIDDACQGAAAPEYFLFKFDKTFPQIHGNELDLSKIRADVDTSGSGGYLVTLGFNGKGDKAFQKITKAEYDRGAELFGFQPAGTAKSCCYQHNAIVLDNELYSTPIIDYTDGRLADGIAGGGQINQLPTFKAANALATVLQTGALPVRFNPIEERRVSATLGKDSLHQAWVAAIGGLIAVALFLLLFYRFLGLVAVIGLGIYVAFLYGAILLLGVTMTLPGFAGMILTIGVAADSNVVIFERIKEEVRAGKSVRAAIAAGYAKGFRTIVDANVVTAITALVLFGVATAGVKGFALMLLVGTVLSLVTAVAATRAMLGLLAGFGWFAKPRFMGAQGQQGAKWLQIDFMRRRNTWFAISGVIMLVGLGSLAFRGLNLGIDFKSGTQLEFSTSKPYTVVDVKNVLAPFHFKDAQVQGRSKASGKGSAATGDHFRNFQIRTEALGVKQVTVNGKQVTDPRLDNLTNALETKLGASSPATTTVSGSFGRQIANDALLAIFVSLGLIVAYIWMRFDLKFAGPVIAALLHDIVITVGVYSVTGRIVTTATVAAVLTVLGYSIYDTIIIFDRVRENIPLMRRSSFATLCNVSLWETIRRSLATTFITLLPVASLFFFGGSTLKDFAFALLVGITSGAYSSIFIAAPLLTMWKEREPEYARRKVAEEDARRAAESNGGTGALDDQALEDAEQAAADEPSPEPIAALSPSPESARLEKRRQRRKSRPHGRPR
jgi:SecD/SecF fusion protein